MTQTLNWLTRMISDCEVQAVSVERVQEYSQLAVEREIPEDAIVPPPDWPSKGQITISDLKLKYRYSTPYVLHGVSANIRGGERVGIAGRTGAGACAHMLSYVCVCVCVCVCVTCFWAAACSLRLKIIDATPFSDCCAAFIVNIAVSPLT